MTAPDRSFDDLMTRLRAGDDDAAAEVFRRFTYRLIGLARSRLDHLIRGKLDPEDILQSVYRTFFRRHVRDGFDLGSWDSLWGMLTVITVRKCDYRRKFFRTARRDVSREVGSRPTDSPGRDLDALARDPTPSEAARLTDTVELLMKELSDREREMLALGLQGYDAPEISARVGRSERTVQRVLKRVRERLEQMRAEPANS
ncbi:MAG TPA: sigma-70 family RNA polymerase sigma factor [Gemmataceae bacterium]|nr:sigma-70 family RNA polymerase sigma factor [Gemmataceae bacterium]